MNPAEYILLIGSPKARKSNSLMLGKYLLQQVQKAGKTSRTFFVNSLYRDEAQLQEFASAIEACRALIIVFPLYVDHVPAPLVRVLEYLHRVRRQAKARPLLLTVINCGFPENVHNQTGAEVLGHFARVSGFEWAGALTFGQGGTIGGKELEKLGGMVRHQRQALEQAAAALLSGSAVNEETTALMARKLMPDWLYYLMANLGWRLEARKNKSGKFLDARPY
jgi:NAD(P)H-dependent FMN reductase